MSMLLGADAIVVGAGMSGLAAAKVLARHFQRVTILERDRLPATAAARPGTPQSNHLHVLLPGGQRALCELFPGFDGDLAKAGAVLGRAGLDVREELPAYDPFPQRELGWSVYSMSRPLIEFLARRRVLDLPNVELRQNCRALDLVAADDGSVSSIRCESSDGVHETLRADLVVDASAQTALTFSLLKATGRQQPQQSIIGIDLEYASLSFAIPKDTRDRTVVITIPDIPASTKAGYLVPVEGNRWMVAVGERHGPGAAANHSEFMEAVRQLRTTTIYDAIKDAEPIDRLHRFGFRESVWRHYEQLSDFPRGLLPIGDAICRFNPVYGQGMTVATMEACVLRDLLQTRVGNKDPFAGLGEAFITAVQPLVSAAWSSAVIPDFAHPQTRGERPADFDTSLQFRKALLRIAARDADVHKLMIAVRHFIEPPASLREPGLVRRVQAEIAAA